MKKGGHDLIVSQPNGAFRAWCAVDLERAREVIFLARNDDPLAKEFSTFALEAGHFVEEARRFVEEYSDERRLSGITALGRMNYSSIQSATNALSTLLNALNSTNDDPLIANILISAFAIKEKQPDLGFVELVEIAKIACGKLGPAVHNASARVLTLHAKIFTPEILSLLLDCLISLDVSHKATIQLLDIGLSQILNGPFGDQAIEFVAVFLSSKQGNLSLEEFQSFGGALLSE